MKPNEPVLEEIMHGISKGYSSEKTWRRRIRMMMAETGLDFFCFSKILDALSEKDIAEYSWQLRPENSAIFNKRIRELLAFRLTPKQELNQMPCTGATLKKRVKRILEDMPLKDKKVLFLGDDDFTSVALALTSDAEVHVVDIDPSILSGIQKASSKFGVKIHLHKHDLREKLPESLRDKFDLFFTDPVYSIRGIKLFLLQGLVALKSEGCRGYLCMPMVQCMRMLRFIESFILQVGFEIVNIERSFNEYTVPSVAVSNLSQLCQKIRVFPKDLKDFTLSYSDLVSIRLNTEVYKRKSADKTISKIVKRDIIEFVDTRLT